MPNKFLKTLLLSVSMCSVMVVCERGYGMQTSQPNYSTIKIKQTIKDAVSKDCHLGLDNVGATCYMNATLQCLSNVSRTSNHVLQYKENGLLNGQNKKLSSAYATVLKNIYMSEDGNKGSYSPDDFK